jgi:hypothetical protein
MSIAIMYSVKEVKPYPLFSDFWEVNKRLARKPFPIPKISMVLQELEVFSYAAALNLDIGY